MIKLNMIELISIFLLLSYFTVLFSGAFYSINRIRKVKSRTEQLKLTLLKVVRYVKELKLEDFNIFQKYNIWRFYLYQ